MLNISSFLKANVSNKVIFCCNNLFFSKLNMAPKFEFGVGPDEPRFQRKVVEGSKLKKAHSLVHALQQKGSPCVRCKQFFQKQNELSYCWLNGKVTSHIGWWLHSTIPFSFFLHDREHGYFISTILSKLLEHRNDNVDDVYELLWLRYLSFTDSFKE